MIGRSFSFILAVALALCYADFASADDRATQIIAPGPPGGGIDIVARVIAQQLSQDLNQKFVVENKAGASTLIGSQFVSRAKRDGSTLLLNGTTLTTAPFLTPNSTFDPSRDLTPITEVAFTPYVLVINSQIPAADPVKLVAWIKANPGKFRWGEGGFGSADYLGIEEFDLKAGIKPLIVTYDGTGPSFVALMSGEIGGDLSPISLFKSGVASGKVKPLGLMSLDEMDLVPGMRTVASYGFPGMASGTWYGLFGPKNMPKDMVERLHDQILKSLSSPKFSKTLLASDMVVKLSATPKEFAAYVKSESDRYGSLIKAINIHGAQQQ